MNEQEKMAQMNAWLDQACAALDVDRGQVAEITSAVLDLVAQVAHGPSRPGAPLTAMVVGIAATRDGGDFAAGVNAAIERLQPLLEG